MKKHVKASLGASIFVGAVYAVGGILGYRAGKSKGKLETHLEQLNENHEQLNKYLKKVSPKKNEES